MDQSIILLTYKGKVLLVNIDYILPTLEKSPWHFISGEKKRNESGQEVVQREVKKKTNVQLETINFLGSMEEKGSKKHFYHACLTDDNVNNIVRRDGELVGFFSIKELTELSLSFSTQLLWERHKNRVIAPNG